MTGVMWLLVVEWGLTVVGAAASIPLFGWPGRYRDPEVAWHLVVWTVTAGLEAVGLLLVVLGVLIPLWVFALAYGTGTGLMYWRLWLLIRSRYR